MKWHHAGIHVSDLETSVAFYEKLFEFNVVDAFHLEGESIVFLQNSDVMLELIYQEEGKPAWSSNHICIEVENIDEWMQTIHRKGLTPVEGPLQLKNGWKTVFYEGPDREVIELLQVDYGVTSNSLVGEL